MQHKKGDLLRHLGVKKKRPMKQWILIVIFCIAGIILLVAGVSAAYYRPVSEAVNKVKSAKTDIETLQRKLTAQDFEGAKKELTSSREKIASAEKTFSSLDWLLYIPLAKTQYQAADNVFKSVNAMFRGLEKVILVAENALTPLQKEEGTTFSAISTEEKKKILQALTEAKPELIDAQLAFNEASRYAESIPEHGLLKPVRDAVAPIKENVPKINESINQILPLTTSLPTLLGYPDEQQYMLLFQNNTELRPTGGFIGTYGIIKIQNAEIISLDSDNVYNLDEAAEKRGLAIEPPGPLFQYNNVQRWFLRDSNWSPDFPTSARKAEELYSLEGGREQDIDGVIAIDPTFISSLLAITGTVKVNGYEFTKDNFVEKLQQHVTQGFENYGIDASDRKDIIGDLAKILIERLFELPKSRWQELFIALEKNLGEKHMLLAMHDEQLSNILHNQSWDGHVATNTQQNDFLLIDANLASLKTDPAVSRITGYTIKENKDGAMQVTIERTYENTGKLTWKTTRYRSYARMYVPEGSTLLSATGQMVDCKKPQEGKIEESQELSHTVFAYFICVEPGESKTVTLTYALPNQFTQPQKRESLSMMIYKQAGTPGDTLKVQAEFKNTIKSVDPILDKNQNVHNNQFSYQTVLRRDKAFTFNFD